MATHNLFANVLNNEVIDNLTDAQADAVLAIFNKPTKDAPGAEPSPFVAEHFQIVHVAPIPQANVDAAKAAALAIIEDCSVTLASGGARAGEWEDNS